MQKFLHSDAPVTASLRDSLRPATLRDELASREIRPPLDAIWALRSRFKSKSLPAEDLVVSIRAVDAATYACHMLPSWLVSPEAEIAKLDATANRLGSYGNSAMAVGDFIFVYTRSPEFVEEVARSCRLRREFMSGSGDDGHDDSAATTVKAWKTLHHAIIHLDQPQATMIECIDEVRRVTGLPFQVDDSIASSTELWKTPRASSAPEFLNELFSTVLTRGLETTYVSSRRCWGVRAGSVWVSMSRASKGTRSTAAIHDFSIVSGGKAGEQAWSDTYQRYLEFKIGSSTIFGRVSLAANQPTAIVRGTRVFLVMSEDDHDLLDDFLQGRFDPSNPGEN
ncbi:MAG: hypothetical protein GC200_12315 [Tepidisphaera sp.]|nr:hypothetical protein [Tepidisphaera sp.]